jgi:signal transduction histidine kinase
VGVMVRLVDDLLDVSRITKGKLRLTTERVDLRVIVNHAVETVRPLMEARTHDFSVSIPTDPIWVEADPARMEQVVVNLLNNAAKYTDLGEEFGSNPNTIIPDLYHGFSRRHFGYRPVN